MADRSKEHLPEAAPFPGYDTEESARVQVTGELVVIFDVDGGGDRLREIVQAHRGVIRVWDIYKERVFVRVWFPESESLEQIGQEIKVRVRGVQRASPHLVPL